MQRKKEFIEAAKKAIAQHPDDTPAAIWEVFWTVKHCDDVKTNDRLAYRIASDIVLPLAMEQHIAELRKKQ